MSIYLALEVADDRRLGAVAAEWDLKDAGLDGLEAELEGASSEGAAAGALVLGRAGRPESAPTLRKLAARLAPPNHRAASLALDLLEPEPPPRLERAESGYRWTDPDDDEVVFIEDDIAAHWHELGRWGPPIRPWVQTPPVEVEAGAPLEPLLDRALEGRRLRVRFEREGLRRPPDLILTKAGFGTDLSCRALVRWSQVRSVGFIEGRRRRVAWAGADERPHALPSTATCGVDRLEALFRGLRATA